MTIEQGGGVALKPLGATGYSWAPHSLPELLQNTPCNSKKPEELPLWEPQPDVHEVARKLEADLQAAREASLDDYRAMINETQEVPLLKLAYSHKGVKLFDELCLRVDVNQAYADCLPQWGDLASKLEVLPHLSILTYFLKIMTSIYYVMICSCWSQVTVLLAFESPRL